MKPNHFLAAGTAYLPAHRPGWSAAAGIGKTVVSSAMIDRVATKLSRRVVDGPVGFKWFTDGLLDGSLGFAGEESAGASFLRHDGTVWTTDKDGLILGLLAAEITARTGHDPGEGYDSITRELGVSFFARVDTAATPAQKAIRKGLSPGDIAMTTLAGEPVRATFAEAPGNGAPIGGVKVVTDGGWFVVRPSGTEDVYKIYAESFRSDDHLQQSQEESLGAIARMFPVGLPAGGQCGRLPAPCGCSGPRKPPIIICTNERFPLSLRRKT